MVNDLIRHNRKRIHDDVYAFVLLGNHHVPRPPVTHQILARSFAPVCFHPGPCIRTPGLQWMQRYVTVPRRGTKRQVLCVPLRHAGYGDNSCTSAGWSEFSGSEWVTATTATKSHANSRCGKSPLLRRQRQRGRVHGTWYYDGGIEPALDRFTVCTSRICTRVAPYAAHEIHGAPYNALHRDFTPHTVFGWLTGVNVYYCHYCTMSCCCSTAMKCLL